MRSFFLLLSVLGLAGCATISGSRQTLVIRSSPRGAVVSQEGQDLGQTPLVTDIKRQSESQLELRQGTSETTLPLHGSYRWGRSFAGNLIFLTWAPVGWIADLLTGAAWEYPTEQQVALGTVATPVPSPPPKSQAPAQIAIAPPLSAHADISDEAGRLLEKKLKKLRPHELKILPYDETRPAFENSGMDFDSEADLPERARIFKDLSVSKIFVSRLDSSQNEVLARGELQDLLNPEQNEKIDVTLSSREMKELGRLGWLGDKPVFVDWLPNSVFLDFGHSATQFTVDGITTRARSKPTDDAIGRAAQYLSTLSFRKVVPPSQREGWRFSFRMSPTANLTYATEVLDGLPAWKDYEFTRLHADAGWGPNFNYGSRHLSFYFNLYPLVSYDSISTQVNSRDIKSETFQTTLGAETGVLYFFNTRWMLRVYGRSANLPRHLWEDVISQATQAPVRLDSVSISSTGLALGYVFPNRDLPY